MSRNNPRSLNMPLQIRRGTDAQRQAMTQALAAGELLYVTDTQRIYVGTGGALGGIAVTGYTNEDAQDAAAQLFANGTHTGITFAYNDAGASMTAVVDLLNNTGTIGGVFKGNVVAEDSTLLIDAASGQIVGPVFANVTGNVTGNLTGNASSATVASTVAITATNSTAANHFITFVDTATGNENLRTDTSLTYDPSTNTLAVSTFQGNLTGNSIGFHDGDVQGSVFANDSSLLVDAIDNKFFGDLVATNITVNDIFHPDSDIGLNLITKVNSSFNVCYYNGTVDARSPITAGNNVGAIAIKGWNGSDFSGAGTLAAAFEAGANILDLAPKSSVFLLSNAGGSSYKTATLDSTGTFSADVFKTGVYANTGARDAAIASPQAGMIIFLTSTLKFQGYTGSGWADLN